MLRDVGRVFLGSGNLNLGKGFKFWNHTMLACKCHCLGQTEGLQNLYWIQEVLSPWSLKLAIGSAVGTAMRNAVHNILEEGRG